MKNKCINRQCTFYFGKNDDEAAEWLYAQENKGAYLKALIREDMKRAGAPAKEETDVREEAKVYPAVQPAGRGS